MPACPAFLVAAPASGQGKTTVVAALAGIVAAWLPARRAAKLDVLKAISST